MLITGIGAFFSVKADIAATKADLQNHKYNHAKLEARVTEHEKRIDDKLDSIHEKIDGIRDLIMDRLKK